MGSKKNHNPLHGDGASPGFVHSLFLLHFIYFYEKGPRLMGFSGILILFYFLFLFFFGVGDGFDAVKYSLEA
jgi:hypothetical protein